MSKLTPFVSLPQRGELPLCQTDEPFLLDFHFSVGVYFFPVCERRLDFPPPHLLERRDAFLNEPLVVSLLWLEQTPRLTSLRCFHCRRSVGNLRAKHEVRAFIVVSEQLISLGHFLVNIWAFLVSVVKI